MTLKHALFGLSLLAAMPAHAASFLQTNLTSDGAVSAAFTDPNLKNPWGISFSPTSNFWLSDNATGLTTLYDGTGKPQSLVVTVPTASGSGTGSPSGQVFNGGSGFVVSQGGKSGAASFIFCTEDGTISGWSPSVNFPSAVIAVNNSAANAVYKGVAIYTPSTGAPVLLATDFHTGVVDVYDSTYKLVTSFRDANLPANYAPYNVAVFGSKIYVTYAQQDAQKHDSVSKLGLGAVEQIDITGKVLASSVHGFLDAPWGLAIAPAGFGRYAGDVLVGNFGNGHITAYTTGLKAAGQLKAASGKAVAIQGLWALSVGNGGGAGSTSDVYFTAGPNDEADGLFGSLSFVH